jgi:hypothetical protein
MNQDADYLRTELPGVTERDPEAAPPAGRQRSRNDSRHLVGAFWPGILGNPPTPGRFRDPESLIAYLTQMARAKIGEKNSDRPTVRQVLLALLLQGVTYREIADHLNASEKTIRRLVRRSKLEAQPCPPS